MKILRTFLSILILCLCSWVSLAQSSDKITIHASDYQNQEVEMADTFRKEGKIYVVVAVVSTVMVGIFAYLFMLERKINHLEKLTHPKS